MASEKVRPRRRVRQLTREEARELFEREAQRYLGMSGEEFIQAWDSGKFDDNPDRPEVMHVVMLLPLAREEAMPDA